MNRKGECEPVLSGASQPAQPVNQTKFNYIERTPCCYTRSEHRIIRTPEKTQWCAKNGVRVREEIPPWSSDRRNVDARNRNAFGRRQVSRGERHRSEERIVNTGMKCYRNPGIRKASQSCGPLETSIASSSCFYPGFLGLQQSSQEERSLFPR